MGMKLLPKSEFDKAKAEEKRREVDEGLKLARRIDNLRETAANEQASLEKFRRETVAQIHEEIATAAKKRDDLKQQVVFATQELEERRKPLDDEWIHVAAQGIANDLKGEELDEREAVLDREEEEVIKDKRQVKTELSKANEYVARSESRFLGAKEAETLAEIALQNARDAESAAMALKKKVEEGLIHREKVVAGQEKSVTLRESDLSAREKALTDRWRLLTDREAQLERNLKRNNHGK